MASAYSFNAFQIQIYVLAHQSSSKTIIVRLRDHTLRKLVSAGSIATAGGVDYIDNLFDI